MELQNCNTTTSTSITYENETTQTNRKRLTGQNVTGINQTSKKKKGGKRGKVPGRYVELAKKRISMFNKRKAGLEKKAMEIEVFTGAKVMLLIYNNESKWIDIYSSQIQDNQPRSNIFNLLKNQLHNIEAFSNRTNKAIRVYHNTELKSTFGVLGSAKTTDLNVNDFGDYIIGGVGNGHITIVNKPISKKRGRARRSDIMQEENIENIPMQIQPYINPQNLQNVDLNHNNNFNMDSFAGFNTLEELYEALGIFGMPQYYGEYPPMDTTESWMNLTQDNSQSITLVDSRTTHQNDEQHGRNEFALKLRNSMDYIISGIKAISELQKEAKIKGTSTNSIRQITGIRFTRV